jgi:AcrR family transcriptional regulator
MRYTPEQKQQTAANILAAAGRGFRVDGYGGAGVDGLAQQAGVTSGAFYKHFRSKAAAFEATVEDGLDQVQRAITQAVAETPDTWLNGFVDYYFSGGHLGNLACSCVLPGLTGDVARGNDEVKAIYQHGLVRVISAVAAGLSHLEKSEREPRARALMAMLTGGVVMTRAVKDPAQAKALAGSLRAAALEFAAWPKVPTKPTKPTPAKAAPRKTRSA